MAERSRRALLWHFEAAMRRKRLWIFTASNNSGRLIGYCVLRPEAAVGGQSMCLIDYQTLDPARDLLSGFLRKALQRFAEEGLYVADLGTGVPKMRGFGEYAPYRGKLTNTVFFYRTDNAEPAVKLQSPEVWDPAPFDGGAAL